MQESEQFDRPVSFNLKSRNICFSSLFDYFQSAFTRFNTKIIWAIKALELQMLH